MNTNSELRFEMTFLNDKIVLEGCCGGVFEVDVNYIGNDSLQILSLTEIDTMGCNENFVTDFYNTIKGAFNSLVGDTITYQIDSYAQILYLTIFYQSNSSFIELTNVPNETNDQSQAPYDGHDPPAHLWSLTQVQYQGQTFDLPYGAALTIADIYEGTFTISLCGEVFAALNFSWYWDSGSWSGPCFISCGILENTAGVCGSIAGYNAAYLQSFKQNAFNFLNDNINQTMEYTFTSSTASAVGSARKLIIEDYSQNKLIFHSNDNYLSIEENGLQPEITVFPNPVNESLSIQTSDCNLCTVKIYSTNGQLLYNENVLVPQNNIDVKYLANGVYFIVVENESREKSVKKFVKL